MGKILWLLCVKIFIAQDRKGFKDRKVVYSRVTLYSWRSFESMFLSISEWFGSHVPRTIQRREGLRIRKCCYRYSLKLPLRKCVLRYVTWMPPIRDRRCRQTPEFPWGGLGDSTFPDTIWEYRSFHNRNTVARALFSCISLIQETSLNELVPNVTWLNRHYWVREFEFFSIYTQNCWLELAQE